MEGGGECEEVKKPKAGGLMVEVKEEEGLMLGSATSSRPTLMKSPGAKATMLSPKHLTLFYGGRVYVFDTITEEKVCEILRMASTTTTAACAAAKSGEVKTEAIGQPGTPILTRSPSLLSTAHVLASPQAQLYPNKFHADLPITRKHSLQRFFEKRRDRLVSKCPYAAPAAETATAEMKLETSPDAGCFDKTLAREGKVETGLTTGTA